MIYRVIEYWVGNSSTPTLEDIEEAIVAAKENNCHVRLYWKGPGYQYYGDTYSRLLSPESDALEIYNGLPKIYGV